ncbi:hypothetical protein ACVWXN_006289 [Bradyrhizobium sp. i1.4.4]
MDKTTEPERAASTDGSPCMSTAAPSGFEAAASTRAQPIPIATIRVVAAPASSLVSDVRWIIALDSPRSVSMEMKAMKGSENATSPNSVGVTK